MVFLIHTNHDSRMAGQKFLELIIKCLLTTAQYQIHNSFSICWKSSTHVSLPEIFSIIEEKNESSKIRGTSGSKKMYYSIYCAKVLTKWRFLNTEEATWKLIWNVKYKTSVFHLILLYIFHVLFLFSSFLETFFAVLT